MPWASSASLKVIPWPSMSAIARASRMARFSTIHFVIKSVKIADISPSGGPELCRAEYTCPPKQAFSREISLSRWRFPGSGSRNTENTLNQSLFDPSLDDFGPLEPHDAPFKLISFPGLYAFFDKDENCLYIGQSVSVPNRVLAHRKKKWYSKVVSRRTLELPDEEERLIRETVLCLSCKPCANRAIKLGKRADGQWYECQFLRFNAKDSKKKS